MILHLVITPPPRYFSLFYIYWADTDKKKQLLTIIAERNRPRLNKYQTYTIINVSFQSQTSYLHFSKPPNQKSIRINDEPMFFFRLNWSVKQSQNTIFVIKLWCEKTTSVLTCKSLKFEFHIEVWQTRNVLYRPGTINNTFQTNKLVWADQMISKNTRKKFNKCCCCFHLVLLWRRPKLELEAIVGRWSTFPKFQLALRVNFKIPVTHKSREPNMSLVQPLFAATFKDIS